MTNLYNQIGNKIRELRRKYPAGSLSQEQLANHLDIASNTVSRWETGTYKPTAEDLDKLARFFHVSITIFFPDQKDDSTRIAALTSAAGDLSNEDLDEVIKYVEFRKARAVLKKAKGSRKKVV